MYSACHLYAKNVPKRHRFACYNAIISAANTATITSGSKRCSLTFSEERITRTQSLKNSGKGYYAHLKERHLYFKLCS